MNSRVLSYRALEELVFFRNDHHSNNYQLWEKHLFIMEPKSEYWILEQDSWLEVPGVHPHPPNTPTHKRTKKNRLEPLKESDGVQKGSGQFPVEYGNPGWQHRGEQNTLTLLPCLPLWARMRFPLWRKHKPIGPQQSPLPLQAHAVLLW